METIDLDFARQVLAAEANAIESMASVIDDSFVQAIRTLLESRGSCIVTGIGKAGLIAQKISATLASTGTPSHFLHAAEAVHGDLGRVRPDDVLVVLSHGGETEEIIRLINLVKQGQVPLIAITGDAQSTLGRHSDIVLCIGKIVEACPLGVAPSVSTTCMLALGDALALTLMKARDFGVEDYVRYHPGGSLGAKLMTVEQSMMFHPGEKLPIASVDDTLEEMLEKTTDVKRHGAVMLVDDTGKLAGIITDADLRRLLTQHGHDALRKRTMEVMTRDCKRIRLDALASEATGLFHQHRIDELPVVDPDDRPVGLIDVQDVVTLKVVG